jgi:tetratricopeptide (TPR) repeat protein
MDVSKFIERADQALRKRMPEQAITLYRQVLVASPGNATARTGLMAAYRKRAELKGGPSLLDRATARSMQAAALGLRSSGKHAAVARTCDAGLEKDPTSTALATLLAAALEEQGHGEEALATWRSVLEAEPDSMVALKHAARLHYECKQIAEAIACLEHAHTLDKHDPEVERLRKNLAAEGTLAATSYTTAKSSRDVIKDKDALRRAEASSRLQRTEETLGQDIDALALRHAEEPANSDVRRQLVKSLQEAGRFDEAEAALAAALARAPGDDALADALGDCRLARNEAGLRAAHAAKDAPAEARLREERTALELAEYERRVKAAPQDGAARLKLARVLYRAGTSDPGATDKAIEQFQAIMPDPRYKLEAQHGLGACFLRKGLYPLAARQFEAALIACGGVGNDRGKEICYHLALVCERQNDRSGALTRYLQIYEIDIGYRDVAARIEALNSPEPKT